MPILESLPQSITKLTTDFLQYFLLQTYHNLPRSYHKTYYSVSTTIATEFSLNHVHTFYFFHLIPWFQRFAASIQSLLCIVQHTMLQCEYGYCDSFTVVVKFVAKKKFVHAFSTSDSSCMWRWCKRERVLFCRQHKTYIRTFN